VTPLHVGKRDGPEMGLRGKKRDRESVERTGELANLELWQWKEEGGPIVVNSW